MPFEIDADFIERYSTLTKRDIGKWGFFMSGCLYMNDNEESARERYRAVSDSAKPSSILKYFD